MRLALRFAPYMVLLLLIAGLLVIHGVTYMQQMVNLSSAVKAPVRVYSHTSRDLESGESTRALSAVWKTQDYGEYRTAHGQDKGIDRNSYFRGKDVPDDVMAMDPPHLLENFKNPCWYERSNLTNGQKVVRCLPYFHLIGVDKCGTTDFWFRLTEHPHIVRPKAILDKETHWWSWRRFGFDIWDDSLEKLHFDWYLSNFDFPAEKINSTATRWGNHMYHHLITGEGSPTEFWDFTGWDRIPQNRDKSPEEALVTPDCIRHLTPDVKLIVLFRNPTKRLYSDYLFLDTFRVTHNLSVAGFHQDVMRSIDMLQTCFSQRSEISCLYDKKLHMTIPSRIIVGMYDIFLDKWLRVFSPEQILVLRNEDYSRDLKAHLRAAFHFLELEPLKEEELDRIAEKARIFETQTGKELGPMWPATKTVLDRFYATYNQRLADRFKDDKFLWLDELSPGTVH